MKFDGHRNAAEQFLKLISGKFYVYVLCRPDGRPFYVGKGLNRRAFEHEAEARQNHPIGEKNPFKCNVIRNIIKNGEEIRYQIDSFYDQEQQLLCLQREAELILTYKRLHEGGVLTNLAGGIGSASGAAPFSLDRHSATLSGEPKDNLERATLNRFLQSIGPVSSVPIKPFRQISRILPTTPHSNPRSPSLRCAYALIASACATATQLTANIVIPRSFTYQGVEAVIENGVSRDMVKSGMVDLISNITPSKESFRLSVSQIDVLLQIYGKNGLSERGLI